MTRVGDGPRRRRMIRGTIVRIGELAVRHGQPSQLATLDCTSSRRSTVMRALLRDTAVTTEYQRDSSSKRPRSSVVLAAPSRAAPMSHERFDVQDCAPCGRRLRRSWTPNLSCARGFYQGKLTLALARAKPPSTNEVLQKVIPYQTSCSIGMPGDRLRLLACEWLVPSRSGTAMPYVRASSCA
jgi:hypothetical protein